MNIHIRIPQQLHDEAMSDLIRPHPFAAERIGFFSVTTGRLSSNMLVLHVGKYHPIPDQDYVDDQGVGARIGGDAIRGALQRILDTGAGQLHVHLHDHRGQPGPSWTDSRELPPLVKSMSVVDASCANGFLILSRDKAWAQIIAPNGSGLEVVNKITVVGFPVSFLNR